MKSTPPLGVARRRLPTPALGAKAVLVASRDGGRAAGPARQGSRLALSLARGGCGNALGVARRPSLGGEGRPEGQACR